MTVLLGTSINYFLEPFKTERPWMLAAGVVCFLLAIVIAAQSQVTYRRGKEEAQYGYCDTGAAISTPGLPYTEIELPFNACQCSVASSLSSPALTTTFDFSSSSASSSSDGGQTSGSSNARNNDDAVIPSSPTPLTENSFLNKAERIAVKSSRVSQQLNTEAEFESNAKAQLESPLQSSLPPLPLGAALAVAVFGGLCFGFFSPSLNVAVNDPFGWTKSSKNDDQQENPNQIVLVERANLCFSFAFWIASIIGNTILLRVQQHQLGKETSLWHLLKTYLLQDSILDRQLAMAAGLVCALGNILQFHGGQLVGYATADLVQAYPLVSTVWDIFLFGEFRNLHCPSCLAVMVATMYVTYFAGVVLFAGSTIPSF